MADSDPNHYPGYCTGFEYQDDKVDLFVLDSFDQNANYSSTSSGTIEYVPQRTGSYSYSESSTTKSNSTVIPYVPKPVGHSSGAATVEYVPSRVTNTNADDTDSPFTPYVHEETQPKANLTPKKSSTSTTSIGPASNSDERKSVKRALSETINPLVKNVPNLPLPTVTAPPPRQLSRSNSAPSADHDTKEAISPSQKSSTSSSLDDGVPAGKKVRIAHTPSYDVDSVPKKPIRKKLGGKQYLRHVMEERYKQFNQQKQQAQSTAASSKVVITPKTESKVQTVNKISTQFSPSKEIIVAKTVSLSCTSAKTTVVAKEKALPPEEEAYKSRFTVGKRDKLSKRVAHVPAKSPLNAGGQSKLSTLIMPIAESSSKIPLSVRRNTLLKLHSELVAGVDDPEELEQLTGQAREYEHEICLRSKNNKSIYVNLGASKVQTIRRERGTVASPAKTPQMATSRKYRQLISTAPAKPLPKVSHDALLNSKAKNCSVVSKEKCRYTDLTREELVAQLSKLAIPPNELENYGFPQRHSDGIEGHALLPNVSNLRPSEFKEGMRLTCRRCHKEYTNPQPENTPCVYHEGRIFKFRDRQGLERQYSCCKGDPQSGGCAIAPCHVTDGLEFVEAHNGFVSTVPGALSGQVAPNVFAIDCEMCYTERALDLSRVTLLNFEGEIVYDSLVKPPGKILDYNTKFSGIKEGDLDNVTTTLEEVQNELRARIAQESILIGHGLDSDFRVLKLFHERVVDTTYLYPHKQGLPFKRSLRNLASTFLNKIIQDSAEGHDSNEDAKAALELVKLKLQDELNKWMASTN